MSTPLWLQAGLLLAYAVLALAFGLAGKRMWPVALYYVGCIVKDAGVMALALWRR